MGDSGVRRSIVSQLSSQYPGLYTDANIAFVGTHQHAGVGGYLENLLPQVTSLGYVKQTADAIIAGTVLAVQKAHASLAPGKLSLGNTTILNANINRSPTAYLANPAVERARYQYDQDKEMTLLRFDDTNGKARGFLSFFAVHGTSLYEVRICLLNLNSDRNLFWVIRTTLWSARITRAWLRICTKVCTTSPSGLTMTCLIRITTAEVEPYSMPGNTTFVAGFTQGKHLILVLSLFYLLNMYSASQRR